MKIKINDDSKKRLEIEIEGVGHTFCNALKEELWNDDAVDIAGYNIDHPLVGKPVMIVETTGKKEPRAAIIDAIKRLKKVNDKVRKNLIKIGRAHV